MKTTLSLTLTLFLGLLATNIMASDATPKVFKQVPTQFIAALGDPTATSGDGAEQWGLWPVDPGPRGVRLKNYRLMLSDGGVTPARWKFDENDWWLEENGLIMEQPQFPLMPGQYIVTGLREAFAMLTIHEPDDTGNQRWELDKGANLYDVTHLGCRSARYTPIGERGTCTPAKAPRDAFRIRPGAEMPPVEGCVKQDYHVLFVVALPADQVAAAN